MTIRTFDDVNGMFGGMDSFDDLRRRLSTPLWNDDSGRQMIDTEDGYALVLDLPGFEREDIDVTVMDGMLTIDATIDASEMDDRDADGVRTLRGATRSRRTHERMRLPEGVSIEDISATYRNGVLEILLPTEDVSAGVSIDVQQ